MEHGDAELGVNKSPVGTRFGFSVVPVPGAALLPWNVGRSSAPGEIGHLGSSRRFSVCLPSVLNTDVYPAAVPDCFPNF